MHICFYLFLFCDGIIEKETVSHLCFNSHCCLLWFNTDTVLLITWNIDIWELWTVDDFRTDLTSWKRMSVWFYFCARYTEMPQQGRDVDAAADISSSWHAGTVPTIDGVFCIIVFILYESRVVLVTRREVSSNSIIILWTKLNEKFGFIIVKRRWCYVFVDIRNGLVYLITS